MDGKDSFLGRLLGNAGKFTTEQVEQTIQLVLEQSVKRHASDIHIEPNQQYVQIRFRIDGSLKSVYKIARDALDILIGQLKVQAHLDATNQRTPQNGHFTAQIGNETFEIRLSIMPVFGGEKAVLHIMPTIRDPYTLEDLGFWGNSLHMLQTTLSRNHGLVIVSAPKHQGRPTTQASMVAALNNPTLNIAAIEETIAYTIPHASQTAVDPRAGLTMHTGLQAALNQDPNVILVGDLPDKATAELATQTATTGHLVIAGLHSNSTTQALLHLQSQHIPEYLLTTALRTVVAQRLIRELCIDCRERYGVNLEEQRVLERAFNIQTGNAHLQVHLLDKQAIGLNIGGDLRPNSTASEITHLWKASQEGCQRCNDSGYQGRTALVEVLIVSDRMKQALISPATSASLQAIALKDGMIPIAIDGLIKALRGVVDIEDVFRSIDADISSYA